MKIALNAMWETYRSINELIKFSDTKAGAILAINGVIITIILSKVVDHIDFVLNHHIILFLLILGFIAGFISICFSIHCLNPTLYPGDPESLIYFGNISTKYSNHNIYKLDVLRYLKDDFDELNQITEQVWTLSKIAWNKYGKVAWAMRFFMVSIFIFLISGIEALYIHQKETLLIIILSNIGQMK